MAVPLHIGPVCINLLTTTVAGVSPISLLLSSEGLVYAKPWTTLMNEAQAGCRLCRILKDFLDQADERSRARRDRLSSANNVSHKPEEERVVHFILRLSLSGNDLLIDAPDTVFAGTLRYKATTNFGKFAALNTTSELTKYL
jgi:hypothetical protein